MMRAANYTTQTGDVKVMILSYIYSQHTFKAWAEGKGASNVCGQAGKNVRRHSLHRLNASMTKQKKEFIGGCV
jgi:hypothetical protein